MRSLSIHILDMVIQRDKPIMVWGWDAPGKTVAVQLGSDNAQAKAAGDKGRWEVIFPAREASAEPQTMVVTADDEKLEMTNIVVGDVWVIPGKSASDMGSVHNGMFGVFKGYNIKGVLFHQGYNNALFSNCRPKLYRVLMKLMVDGWREDLTARPAIWRKAADVVNNIFPPRRSLCSCRIRRIPHFS